jgi:hypothetical protein
MSPRKSGITKKKAKVDRRRATVRVCRACRGECAFNRWRSIAFCGLLLWAVNLHAQQCQPKSLPLNQGEVVNYDIYFKWGLLMSHAGEGRLSYEKTTYGNRPASIYQLLFRTTGLLESFYKMRDTLECNFDPSDHALLYSVKRSNEGGSYTVDELTFSYANDRTDIHSYRYTPKRVRFDTTLTVTSGCVTDMLGTTFFIRTLDWDKLDCENNIPLTVAVGRDLVTLVLRYQGQTIVERDNCKYKTHYFLVDIYDEIFTQKKSAAELWVGDDANHIPVKIKSKLKIGSAEIYYKSSSNLKAPLDCRVETTKSHH